MDQDLSQYPEGSVLSQILIDMYAHEEKITILYDRTLTQELLELEYNPKKAELYFNFTPGRVPFGEKIQQDIARVLKKVKTATLLQIDMNENEIVFGMEVPVKLI